MTDKNLEQTLYELNKSYTQRWDIGLLLENIGKRNLPYQAIERPLLEFLKIHRDLIWQDPLSGFTKNETELISLLKASFPVERWSLFTPFLPRHGIPLPKTPAPICTYQENYFVIIIEPKQIAQQFPTLCFDNEVREIINHIGFISNHSSVLDYLGAKSVEIFNYRCLVQAKKNPTERFLKLVEGLLASNLTSRDSLEEYAIKLVPYLVMNEKLPMKPSQTISLKKI